MAFRSASTDTYTFAVNSTGSTVDLGASNNYRYINATNVYNKGKADGNIKNLGFYYPIPSGKMLRFVVNNTDIENTTEDIPTSSFNCASGYRIIPISRNNLTTLHYQKHSAGGDFSRKMLLLKNDEKTYIDVGANAWKTYDVTGYDYLLCFCQAGNNYSYNIYF